MAGQVFPVKLAVVRVRGGIRARGDVEDTLRMLGLTRVNHCVVIDDTPSLSGMLQKVKDYITWGEIKPETLEILMSKRGRLIGDRKIDEDTLKAWGFSSFQEIAEAICSGKISIRQLPGLKKVFRLHPPRKGYRSTKKSVGEGGSLGYCGDKINDLIKRMV